MVKDVARGDDGVVLTVRACLHVLAPQTNGYGGRDSYQVTQWRKSSPAPNTIKVNDEQRQQTYSSDRLCNVSRGRLQVRQVGQAHCVS